MRREHLELLRPVCPSCRSGELRLSKSIRAREDDVEEGLLECANATCRHEYPIVDGIPIVVADLHRVVSEQVLGIFARTDLSEELVATLNECAGPSAALDVQRQHLSTYVHGHWGDKDPGPRLPDEHPGSVVKVLDRGLAALPRVEGPILDVGCSVGRTTWELARRGVVAAVDLSFSMLRIARRAYVEGRVVYARRRVGLVYEERSFEVEKRDARNAGFWCADALALPFAPATFGTAVSLNLLDCVTSPLDHLRSLRDVVKVGGHALLCTPFDWSPNATQPLAWVGGHSPRGEARGRSEVVLRQLLSGGHPSAVEGLSIVEEMDGLDWEVRLHDRSAVRYKVDLLALARG